MELTRRIGFSKDVRTYRVQKNSIIILLVKGTSITISFLLMKVTLDYMNKDVYGVWLTILSIISWVSIFDIGLGNGLRNKLTEALASDNKRVGKTYVSTTYALIGFLIVLIFGVYIVVADLLDWDVLLGANHQIGQQVGKTVTTLFICFLLQFFFSLINQIAMAFHDSAIPSYNALVTNIVILVSFYIMPKWGYNTLYDAGLVYGIESVAVYLATNILLFRKKYKDVRPSLSCIDFRYTKFLLTLGVNFFLIQISGIVIFSTDNFIITKFLGPEYVVPYQVAFKLFSVFSIGHSILLTPVWSLYTDAYIKGDFGWIRRTINKFLILMIPISIALGSVVLFAAPFISLWMGRSVDVDRTLIYTMAIYVFVMMWNNIFAFFLNGISRVKVQMYCGVFGAVLNIPLSIYLVQHLHMGSSAIVLASTISLLPSSVFTSVQTFNIIKRTKTDKH